jgi:hypothetical protein
MVMVVMVVMTRKRRMMMAAKAQVTDPAVMTSTPYTPSRLCQEMSNWEVR